MTKQAPPALSQGGTVGPNGICLGHASLSEVAEAYGSFDSTQLDRIFVTPQLVASGLQRD